MLLVKAMLQLISHYRYQELQNTASSVDYLKHNFPLFSITSIYLGILLYLGNVGGSDVNSFEASNTSL